VNLQQQPINIQEELTFLRMEIKLLKTLIKSNNITRSSPIERIKITKQDLGPSREKNKMSDVIKEMKELFIKSEGDYRGILYHIDAIETIRTPPIPLI